MPPAARERPHQSWGLRYIGAGWHTGTMDPAAPAPRLLEQDTLVMQQITGFMSNDFDILDGTPLASLVWPAAPVPGP